MLSLAHLVLWISIMSDHISRHMSAGWERPDLTATWRAGNVVSVSPQSWAAAQEPHALLSCRDGAPYCEKDYQGLFGVKCEACHQFITGKVLEVSDRRAPLKATIVFARGPPKRTRVSFAMFSIFFSSVEERK